jgi:hypothetical protein
MTHVVSPAIVDFLIQLNVDVDLDPAAGLAGGAVGAFLTTLIVGAILVAVVPDYTVDRMAAVLDDPLGALVYGIAVFFVLAVLVFVLVLSIVGILVVIPLVFLLYVLWAVGSTIAFLAIADRLVDRGDDWLKPLLVAAAINGGLALTGIGGILALVVGAAGFGAVLDDLL